MQSRSQVIDTPPLPTENADGTMPPIPGDWGDWDGAQDVKDSIDNAREIVDAIIEPADDDEDNDDNIWGDAWGC